MDSSFAESLKKGELIPEMGVHMTACIQQFLVDVGNCYAKAIPGLMELWNRYGREVLLVSGCNRQGWLVDDDMVINCLVPGIKRYFVGDHRALKLAAAFVRMLFFTDFVGYQPRIPMTSQKEVELFIHCYSTVFNTSVATVLPGATLAVDQSKRIRLTNDDT